MKVDPSLQLLARQLVSKKQGDAHAEGQYEQFAAQRWALLEAEGGGTNVRALEDAAKALQKPVQKRK